MPIVEADPAACLAAPKEQPPLAALVKGEQIRAQYECMPGELVGGALCATLLAVALVHRLTLQALAVWLLATYGSSGLRGLLWYRFRRAGPALAALPRWQRRLTASAAITGLIWGTGGILLHPPGSFTQQIFVLLVMLGMALTALLLASGSVTTFAVFIYPLLCLSAVPFLMAGDGADALIGLSTLLLLPIMTHLGRRLALELAHTIETRLSHGQLLVQLSVQKKAAEEASLAKSRFLAMASHDLRQPLHALNLFVQALQERRLPREERELIANVRRSVDAMDELFDALLDISRLDAGNVRGRVTTFPLEELFERLRFEFGAVAREKGLRFTVQKTRLYVRSDQKLLNQILRNLLANAMRYTETGGVLMGCRWGRDSVRIEVWDTGCGIPDEQHALVFQEFAQLRNPERDRRKGLGLGLAIVSRLARVLAHSITLRSRVGQGSMFAVNVPRGAREEDVRAVAAANEPAHAFDLSGIAVLVIDEDRAVREGLERLLTKWRCQVIAAESGAQAMQQLAARAKEGRRPPDIIIVDYHQRELANNLTVLQQLEREIVEMPALVVTAASAQERRDCEASGVPVLGKPVSAARLRTLLAHIAARVRTGGARRAG